MIGVVVNPVAGVGGPAGLAGSDGADVQRSALARGARSRAQERAILALTTLAERHPGLVVATVAGAMGADAVRAAGLVSRVVGVGARDAGSAGSPEAAGVTEAADTSRAVAALAAVGADLILVVGGDGTLRDAVSGLGAVGHPWGERVDGGRGDDGSAFEAENSRQARSQGGSGTRTPRLGLPAVLGVPAGVKMYSSVFAVSPRAAGSIAADWVDHEGLPTEEREVLDIDEAAMRRARVDPTLYGMLQVPHRSGRTQARKAPTPVTEAAAVEAAARGAVSRMRPGVRYLLGPGGTIAEITRQLGVEGSPLGVDVVLDGAILVRGASEQELLDQIAQGPAQAVVTVIGGQGFLLGRGNQQLSASVLRALGDDPLLVVAPEQKLIDLHGRPLLVDTGDPELDARFAGHVRIITGVGTRSLYAVNAPELTLA
ncbi:NAD(+)/NADH kinase [Microbacterium sp.]|uniref:ATP-NAD kinase family protein n=1 Tax=Microbacterium sp. TaxID=51671 RepID=UPI00261DDE41|nr:NAD(+)/NADH kinase [Microbacterium sp.]MCV0336340.1 NAD(+)/NADH kinase [Microbacterium sp.]MCV0376723.1 NAD(+)/NADH kinase [Microbacterium sp.]MCV0391472.1 NAD(+)/NADH kinase [Microbacterium sp.]MCV0420168.1 NAD(+)/NADH kinase [Microbacterium sp.]MCV0423751.1 NAD(+)/NADH kinase [Microbacterium sp.]